MGKRSGDPWPFFGYTCVDREDREDQVDEGAAKKKKEFTNQVFLRDRHRSEEKNSNVKVFIALVKIYFKVLSDKFSP